MLKANRQTLAVSLTRLVMSEANGDLEPEKRSYKPRHMSGPKKQPEMEAKELSSPLPAKREGFSIKNV